MKGLIKVGGYQNPGALAKLLAKHAVHEGFTIEPLAKRRVASNLTRASECDDWEDICDEDAVGTIDTTLTR